MLKEASSYDYLSSITALVGAEDVLPTLLTLDGPELVYAIVEATSVAAQESRCVTLELSGSYFEMSQTKESCP